MQMTDLSFLLYFLPAMLLGYFALSFSGKAQNLWLVLASFLFYSFGSITYGILLFVMAMINYHLGYVVQNHVSKRMMWFAVAVNILPLIFFRHLHPLISGIAGLFDVEIAEFAAVPLGISFIALQGISYVVDIARGKVKWNPRFTDTALYLSFFPVLQAGPVIRYHQVAHQIKERQVSFDKVTEGICRFVAGLAKVVLIAAPLLKVADIVFEQSNNSGVYTTVPILLALLGLMSFAVGIYHQLSGFSDMVTGLGGILGFVYPENFNYPIMASSMTLFWKRCYISLTEWFEEYVYQSLETDRTNNDRMVLHLLFMWVLIGLWLGPGIPNLIFGLLSFLVILIERIVELDEKESGSPLRHAYVVFIMLVSAAALKTDTIYQFTLFISNLFGMSGGGFYSELAVALWNEIWYVFVLGLICSFPITAKIRQAAGRSGSIAARAVYIFYPVVMAMAALLLLITLSNSSYDPGQLIHLQLWR